MTCKRCNKTHHTLLHREQVTPNRTTASSIPAETPANPSTSNLVTSRATMAGTVNGKATTLLMTCELVVNVQGRGQKARALIDTGSSISFITCRLANSLQAKKIPRTTNIVGIQGQKVSSSQCMVDLNLIPSTGSLHCRLSPFHSYRD